MSLQRNQIILSFPVFQRKDFHIDSLYLGTILLFSRIATLFQRTALLFLRTVILFRRIATLFAGMLLVPKNCNFVLFPGTALLFLRTATLFSRTATLLKKITCRCFTRHSTIIFIFFKSRVNHFVFSLYVLS